MDLYQDVVLEHAKHPHHFGMLTDSSHSAKATNASCGDMLEIQLKVDKDEKIVDVAWRGVSCALSTATASVLSDYLIGKKLVDVQNMTLSDLLTLLGLEEILPTREKCVLLPLNALKQIK